MAVVVDLDDFDAVGVVTDAVAALRAHAIEHDTDAAATLAAPTGYQQVVLTARRSGHVVVGVRFSELGRSRWNNLAAALDRRGWDLDADHEGATTRFPPGTSPSDAAFEVLAVAAMAGAPTGPRPFSALDGAGRTVPLEGET